MHNGANRGKAREMPQGTAPPQPSEKAETKMQAVRAIPMSADISSETHVGHKHRKASDPFLHLDDDAIKLSEPSPPSKEESDAVYSSTSLFSDLVLTPLHFITFVLSLSLIDFRQRRWRLSQHVSDHESLWFRITHWSWLHPEPYQDSHDSIWKHNDKSAPQISPDRGFQGWYTQKKHRDVTKMEISDAFEIRGRVFVALLAWTVVCAFGLMFVARRLYRWF